MWVPPVSHTASTCICVCAVVSCWVPSSTPHPDVKVGARFYCSFTACHPRPLLPPWPSLLSCCPPHLQAALMARLSAVQLPALAVIHAARPTTRLAKCAARLASVTTSAARPTAHLASCAAMCASTPKPRCDLVHLLLDRMQSSRNGWPGAAPGPPPGPDPSTASHNHCCGATLLRSSAAQATHSWANSAKEILCASPTGAIAVSGEERGHL